MTDRLPEEHPAFDAVRADLRMLADHTPPMPPELALRLDRALEEERDRPAGVYSPPPPEPSRPARAPWWRRPALLASVAAGVVAIAGVGIGVAAMSQSGSDDTATSAPEANSAQDAPGAGEDLKDSGESDELSGSAEDDGEEKELQSAPTVIVSAREYTRDTLGQLYEPFGADGRPDPALDRLTPAPGPAFTACLDAITGEYPGSVVLVDFAYFEETPALVVNVSHSDGSNVIVVVGADCGLAGADELYSAEA